MSKNQRYQQTIVPSSHQQGAVLIVVLLFLVLIILAGVIAVKQSTTDLKLATSDQINTLLLQSADNANQNIEQSMNGSSDADAYDAMIARGGPFGYFILTDYSVEHEYVFCFVHAISYLISIKPQSQHQVDQSPVTATVIPPNPMIMSVVAVPV